MDVLASINVHIYLCEEDIVHPCDTDCSTHETNKQYYTLCGLVLNVYIKYSENRKD